MCLEILTVGAGYPPEHHSSGNADSHVCTSSLHRGHAHASVIPVSVRALPKQTPHGISFKETDSPMNNPYVRSPCHLRGLPRWFRRLLQTHLSWCSCRIIFLPCCGAGRNSSCLCNSPHPQMVTQDGYLLEPSSAQSGRLGGKRYYS